MASTSIRKWLEDTTSKLSSANIATARLDALVLLEDELNTNRTHLLAHPEIELAVEHVKVLAKKIARRARHEPLAYIRGKTEFYGREFIVSPAVLEPRPESETMIEVLLNADLPARPRILDVGTGSGAIGITAQLELPQARIDLLEIDSDAIKVAKKNVIKFATEQCIFQADLLTTTPQSYDVLLCNLPYVPDRHTINQAAMHEPKLAIFGGPDGLDIYRRLFQQIKKLPKRPLLILCESLPPQHEAFKIIASDAGYKKQAEADFIQVFSSI